MKLIRMIVIGIMNHRRIVRITMGTIGVGRRRMSIHAVRAWMMVISRWIGRVISRWWTSMIVASVRITIPSTSTWSSISPHHSSTLV